jgi:hypothetical protein
MLIVLTGFGLLVGFGTVVALWPSFGPLAILIAPFVSSAFVALFAFAHAVIIGDGPATPVAPSERAGERLRAGPAPRPWS